MKIGLKLWSENTELIARAGELFRKNICDFLELYVVPGSEPTIEKWRVLDFPIILHAAHSHGGLNMAEPDVVAKKRAVFAELDKFNSALDAESVIFHPGVDGELSRTIGNFADMRSLFPALADSALIENKPLRGLNGETCVGYAPADIEKFKNAAGIGVCLDFGHAIAAANSMKRSWKSVVDEFMKLNPDLFHLSDGCLTAEMDSHLNLGDGDYPIAELAAMCHDDAMVTLETAKVPKRELDDFAEDVEFLSATLET
ncbi:MAG: hypothetical protein GXP32_09680 [Kiritimatiellaeota bacterium]|nr:hypothetical protein [Kiritimatiellota bacterium]